MKAVSCEQVTPSEEYVKESHGVNLWQKLVKVRSS